MKNRLDENCLEEIRKSKHISREKLSRMSGVPTRAIKAYEYGQVPLHRASYIYVIQLAHSLEVKPADLFGGDLQ